MQVFDYQAVSRGSNRPARDAPRSRLAPQPATRARVARRLEPRSEVAFIVGGDDKRMGQSVGFAQGGLGGERALRPAHAALTVAGPSA
jgi:hypothetical protein